MAKTKDEIAELNEMLIKTNFGSDAAKLTDNANGCSTVVEPADGIDISGSDGLCFVM